MNFGKVIAGFGLLVLIGVCGCGAGKEKSNPGKLTRLNEQQIEILEQEGLPTDIEKLSASQKRCIMKIDAMMNYMEETYGEEFVFDGYNEPEILDKREKLYVYRAVDTDKTSLIEVDRKWENDEWVYEDDYLCAYAASYWKELVREYLKDLLQEDQFKIRCMYAGYENDATTENIKKDFKKYTCNPSAYIDIDGGSVSEKEYEELINNLKRFAKEEGFENFGMFLLKKGVMQRKEELSENDEIEYSFEEEEDYIRVDYLL